MASALGPDRAVGLRARIKASGREGVVVKHDPRDEQLTYKVEFADGADPPIDWFARDQVDVGCAAPAPEPNMDQLHSAIEFTESSPEGKIQVMIHSLGGARIGIAGPPEVAMCAIKDEVARSTGVPRHEFKLVGGTAAPIADAVTLGALSEADGKAVFLYMVRHRSLERHEAEGKAAWVDVALALKDQGLEDDAVLAKLARFLDAHPRLINWQWKVAGDSSFKPLLLFAVEHAKTTNWRRKCVDELLRRGARVHIRHAQGFLIERARASGSAFAALLEGKGEEFAHYERRAIAAWREVSSKLCGETHLPEHDEDRMTGIVRHFCATHPEMVNFQSNHAFHGDDVPYGYFEYAPLITFAGAQACRRGRGGDAEDRDVRRGSVQELLRHGARIDMEHGSKVALDWMRHEGSSFLPWLEAQLLDAVPEQAEFVFSRT